MAEQTKEQLIAAKLDANPALLEEAREAVCAVVAKELWDEMESGGEWYEIIMDGLREVSSYTTKELANKIAYHMKGEETTLEKWIVDAKASVAPCVPHNPALRGTALCGTVRRGFLFLWRGDWLRARSNGDDTMRESETATASKASKLAIATAKYAAKCEREWQAVETLARRANGRAEDATNTEAQDFARMAWRRVAEADVKLDTAIGDAATASLDAATAWRILRQSR